jgi:predicted nicotinamide N-methyase
MQPIPSQILKDSIVIKNPTGVDAWNNTTYETLNQSRVHIQGANRIMKNKDNSEVQLSSTLFVDKRLSTPFIDWAAMQIAAEQTGHEIMVEAHGHEYTVLKVDDVPDPHGMLHHYEIGLI